MAIVTPWPSAAVESLQASQMGTAIFTWENHGENPDLTKKHMDLPSGYLT